MRLLARRILEKQGFRVMEAADGKQALEVLGGHPGEVQTVLLDLNMPGLSGEPLVTQIHALEPRARIVVSSSLEQTLAQARLGPCFIAGFIQKPCRLAGLLDLLRRLGSPPYDSDKAP